MEDIENVGGPWSRIIRHDPETGTVCMTYACDRRPGYSVKVDSPKAKKLAGYSLIEQDMGSAAVWLNKILDLAESDRAITGKSGHIFLLENSSESSILGLALFVAAVTFYGKCFSNCEGRKVKLEKSNLSKEFHREHDFAITCRNNFTAHSGAIKFESADTILVLDSGKKVNPYLLIEISQTNRLTSNSIKDLVVLLDHAKSITTKKLEQLYSSIMQDDVFSKPAHYWYEKAGKK